MCENKSAGQREREYYLCSKNKGAEADLRLCFRICKIQFSHVTAHIIDDSNEHSNHTNIMEKLAKLSL